MVRICPWPAKPAPCSASVRYCVPRYLYLVVYYVQYYLEYVYPASAKVAKAMQSECATITPVLCAVSLGRGRRQMPPWPTTTREIAGRPLNAQGAAASWDARRGAAAVGCSAAAPHRDSAAVLVPSRQHIEREHRGRWRSVRWRHRPHQRRSASAASCSQRAPLSALLTGRMRAMARRM
jgi:hypothetical protein